MAGRPSKVDHVRNDFLKEIGSARALVEAINGLPQKVRPSLNPSIHPTHAKQVTGLAFMGVVSAWEEFLERTLTRYIAGAETDGGYSPLHKHGAANSIDHAYELLSQDANYDRQKNYLKVNDPRWVWRTADFFFSQHPYTCLSSKADLLKYANNVRNRIAHNSQKCRTDFTDAVVWFTQPPGGKLRKGRWTPDMLLAQKVQRHFGQQTVQAGHSHFEAYMMLYESLARFIVP